MIYRFSRKRDSGPCWTVTFVVSAIFGDVAVSLFGAAATFGDAGVSLLVAGAAFGENWGDSGSWHVVFFDAKCVAEVGTVSSANGRVRLCNFVVGIMIESSAIVRDASYDLCRTLYSDFWWRSRYIWWCWSVSRCIFGDVGAWLSVAGAHLVMLECHSSWQVHHLVMLQCDFTSRAAWNIWWCWILLFLAALHLVLLERQLLWHAQLLVMSECRLSQVSFYITTTDAPRKHNQPPKRHHHERPKAGANKNLGLGIALAGRRVHILSAKFFGVFLFPFWNFAPGLPGSTFTIVARRLKRPPPSSASNPTLGAMKKNARQKCSFSLLRHDSACNVISPKHRQIRDSVLFLWYREVLNITPSTVLDIFPSWLMQAGDVTLLDLRWLKWNAPVPKRNILKEVKSKPPHAFAILLSMRPTCLSQIMVNSSSLVFFLTSLDLIPCCFSPSNWKPNVQEVKRVKRQAKQGPCSYQLETPPHPWTVNRQQMWTRASEFHVAK